jgi:putative tricarboxylic transport membrane protein
VAVGAGLAFGATQISSAAGYGGVGPNFLAWVVATMLLCGGALLVWQARSGGFREREQPSGSPAGYWPGFAWVSAGLLVNAALITRIGFILSCGLCFVLAARGFKSAEGRRDLRPQAWLFDALVGLSIAAPVYWMFSQLLGINLPGLTSTGWI